MSEFTQSPRQEIRDYLKLDMGMDSMEGQLQVERFSALGPFMATVFLIFGTISLFLMAVLVSWILVSTSVILLACAGFFYSLMNRRGPKVTFYLGRNVFRWVEGIQKREWRWSDITAIKVYSTGPELHLTHQSGETVHFQVARRDAWNKTTQTFEAPTWVLSIESLEWLADTMNDFRKGFGSEEALPEDLKTMRGRKESTPT